MATSAACNINTTGLTVTVKTDGWGGGGGQTTYNSAVGALLAQFDLMVLPGELKYSSGKTKSKKG